MHTPDQNFFIPRGTYYPKEILPKFSTSVFSEKNKVNP